MPLALWMDPESIILNEVSQAEKDKYYMMSLICGIRKIVKMNLFTKQKQTHRHRKQTCVVKRERGEERMDSEFGISWCRLLGIGWRDSKVLLHRELLRGGEPLWGPETCLTFRNVLSKEMLMLTKQETSLGRGTQVENRREREVGRTALPRDSQSRALWWWDQLPACLWPVILT